MRRTITLVVLLLWPMSAFAQQPLDVVAAHRQKYPERLSPADAPRLLREIAGALSIASSTGVLHWGRLIKTTGNTCGGYACDIVCSVDAFGETWHYDVFIDGPDAAQNHSGKAEPTWNDKGSIERARCELVSFDPPAPPPPPVDDATLTVLRAQIEAWGVRVGELEHRIVLTEGALSDVLRLDERIAGLEARPIPTPPKPFPCSTGRVFIIFRYWTIRSCPEEQP